MVFYGFISLATVVVGALVLRLITPQVRPVAAGVTSIVVGVLASLSEAMVGVYLGTRAVDSDAVINNGIVLGCQVAGIVLIYNGIRTLIRRRKNVATNRPGEKAVIEKVIGKPLVTESVFKERQVKWNVSQVLPYALIAALGLYMLYWTQIRPVQIREECERISIAQADQMLRIVYKYGGTFGEESGYDQIRMNTYRACVDDPSAYKDYWKNYVQ